MSGPDHGIVKPDRRHCREVLRTWMDGPVSSALELWEDRTVGYFGDRYGLTQVAVEIEGKEPTPRYLAGLIDRAKNDGVKVVFVQPQYAKKHAETIAGEIKGAVVPMKPLPCNYLENLAELLRTHIEAR